MIGASVMRGLIIFYKKSPPLMIGRVLNNNDNDFRIIRMVLAFQVHQQKSLST